VSHGDATHAAGAISVVKGAETISKLLLFQAADFAAAEQEAEAQSHVHYSAFDAVVVDVTTIGEDVAERPKVTNGPLRPVDGV
jgi:hypothetical protein